MAGLEEDDDENQQRDALDWLYIASRCVFGLGNFCIEFALPSRLFGCRSLEGRINAMSSGSPSLSSALNAALESIKDTALSKKDQLLNGTAGTAGTIVYFFQIDKIKVTLQSTVGRTYALH